jgi:hypothetical protein
LSRTVPSMWKHASANLLARSAFSWHSAENIV